MSVAFLWFNETKICKKFISSIQSIIRERSKNVLTKDWRKNAKFWRICFLLLSVKNLRFQVPIFLLLLKKKTMKEKNFFCCNEVWLWCCRIRRKKIDCTFIFGKWNQKLSQILNNRKENEKNQIKMHFKLLWNIWMNMNNVVVYTKLLQKKKNISLTVWLIHWLNIIMPSPCLKKIITLKQQFNTSLSKLTNLRRKILQLSLIFRVYSPLSLSLALLSFVYAMVEFVGIIGWFVCSKTTIA